MDTREQYIEDLGLYFEANGLTRMAGRVIGFLLICDPPQQTMPDIIEALQVSKSNISTTLTLLRQNRLVDRISLPGERRDYYRLNPDLWTNAFLVRAGEIRALRLLAERGLKLLENASPDARKRLELVREMNAFMEEEFPRLIERWNEVKKAKGLES